MSCEGCFLFLNFFHFCYRQSNSSSACPFLNRFSLISDFFLNLDLSNPILNFLPKYLGVVCSTRISSRLPVSRSADLTRLLSENTLLIYTTSYCGETVYSLHSVTYRVLSLFSSSNKSRMVVVVSAI